MKHTKISTTKLFNVNGQLVSDENKEEVFVHKTGLIDNIQEDDNVEFDVEQGKRGLNAVNVSKV